MSGKVELRLNRIGEYNPERIIKIEAIKMARDNTQFWVSRQGGIAEIRQYYYGSGKQRINELVLT